MAALKLYLAVVLLAVAAECTLHHLHGHHHHSIFRPIGVHPPIIHRPLPMYPPMGVYPGNPVINPGIMGYKEEAEVKPVDSPVDLGNAAEKKNPIANSYPGVVGYKKNAEDKPLGVNSVKLSSHADNTSPVADYVFNSQSAPAVSGSGRNGAVYSNNDEIMVMQS